ncbi:PQQ-binding-like beta-propeller repeat protein [candidate division KSB1 bacterium]|nr:PQQ-binding-like beta-propeller repeat protein [candidate division KSB1 bacterium]
MNFKLSFFRWDNGAIANRTILWAVCGFVVATGFIGSVTADSGINLQPLWELSADMVMEGAPMVVDLDGDGDAEILTAAYENIIVADGSGKELWRFDTRGRYSTCPAIWEREKHLPLIYAGDNTGMFTCLDGSGKVVWQAETAPIFCASPAIADLDADGELEVVQGDKKGIVSVFDALTGELEWSYQIDGECASSAIGDLNADGVPEIIITTGSGKVYALTTAGHTLWEFNVGCPSMDWATSSPVLFKNSTGQLCIAAGSQAGRFFCLDQLGNVLWERTTRGAIASTISVGDLDADGRADVFVVTQLGVLYRFDENGRVLWDIDTQGRSLAAGAIIDLDGDDAFEYALSTQRGNLLVFNTRGKVVFNHQFDNRTINVTPAFGDIVKERPGLEMAFTGGEGGMIYCFATPAPVVTSSQWSTYRCDNRLNAAWLGLSAVTTLQMFPENLSWDQVYTGSDIIFRVKNPASYHSMLKAEASCIRPDGSRQSAVGKIIGQQGLLQLPITMTAPGSYHFEWAVKNEAGRTLINGSRELTLQPYLNDQALAQRAILALDEKIRAAKKVSGEKGLSAALMQESKGIAKEASELALLQKAAPGASPEFGEKLNARTENLNARSERALALARITESILKNAPKSQLLAFEGLMWENRDVDRQLPSNVAIPLKIHRRCVPGEHEPVSIKLLNVTLETVTAGCKIQKQSDAPDVTIFEVKPVPTNQKTIAWDPIVPLTKQLSIPSLQTREVWLDIDLSKAVVGTHEISATFNTGKSESVVQISLEVLPFEIAAYDSIRLCCWASYNEDAVRDLLAHGNTVFTCALPPVKVSSENPLTLDIDFTDLDEFTNPMQEHDVYLLMTGIPDLGVPMEDEGYVPRLADYVDQVMRHLAARGIGENQIALYPHDEPGGHGWDTVNHYIAFARQGLKARPGLKFYVNGGGDVAMFEALNPIAAIWCPGYYILPEESPLKNFLRKSGKILWTYDCGYAYARPIGANTKSINVVAQYRLPALAAVNYGATGIGYWCYNVGPSMWEPIDLEYPLVYVNENGTHTSSRRWEAVRESVDDARILIALREKLNDPAVSDAVKSRIRCLFEETLAAFAEQSLREVQLGVARYVIDATNSEEAMQKLRNEILDCVALLNQ